MSAVALPLTGRCHCGATSYEVSQRRVVTYACHCRNCQRISGSAFALSVIVREESLVITGPVKRTNWVAESGNSRWGDFCADCGSRIAHGTEPSIGMLVVRAGTLDDPSWFQPTAHIWTSEAQPWFMFADDEVRFEGQPQDTAPLIERFARLGLFS